MPKESPFLWAPTEEICRRSCRGQDNVYLSLPFKDRCKSHDKITSNSKSESPNESRNCLCLDPFESINSANENLNLLVKDSYITTIDKTSMYPKSFRFEPKSNAHSYPNIHSNKALMVLCENRYKKNKRTIDRISKNAQYFFKSHKPKMSKVKKTKKLPGTEELILDKVVDNLALKVSVTVALNFITSVLFLFAYRK